MNEKSFTLTDPAAFEIFDTGPTLSGAHVTANTALQVPAVLQAVRLISETVGSLPCKLYTDTDGSKEAATAHHGYRLAHNRANEWTSASQLRIELTADALMHGAGYAHVERNGQGRPIYMRRLPPNAVTRKFEDDGEPFYLVSQKRGKALRLPFRDVLHISAFNGVAPLKAGKRAIGLAMVLERHAERFFGGGARPNAVIWREAVTPDNDTGANTTTNILKDYRKSFEGDGPSRPLILSGGYRYQATTMNSTDAQFLENRIEQINEVARIFGVPPTMLYQLDRGTWGNAEQMAASFLQLCLRPWLDRWQDAYATVLLTEDEQDAHYFEFVIDDLQRADAAARAEIFGKLVAMRAMTPNEVRAAMNLPALAGGDELANPYTTTTTPGNSATVADSPLKEAA